MYKVVHCTWKRPKCSLTGEWIREMMCVPMHAHSGILLSQKKKTKIMPFVAAWMDLEMIIFCA